MKTFNFGSSKITLIRSANFFEGNMRHTETLITTEGEINPVYLGQEIIDLAAYHLGQNLFKDEIYYRRTETRKPIDKKTTYELFWSAHINGKEWTK